MRTSPRLLAAIAILALVGCTDTTGPDGIVGTYALVSHDGEPLPYVYYQAGTRVETVEAATLSIHEDGGTFTIRSTLRITTDSGSTVHTDLTSGTYTYSDRTLTMYHSGGGAPEIAAYSRDRIVMEYRVWERT